MNVPGSSANGVAEKPALRETNTPFAEKAIANLAKFSAQRPFAIGYAGVPAPDPTPLPPPPCLIAFP